MNSLEEILEWYMLAGVDETLGDEPFRIGENKEDKKTPMALVRPATTDLAQSSVGAVMSAREICESVDDLDSLKAEVEKFEGCALKLTAKNTVFGDGNQKAKIVIIGEAPGADEDRIGVPFVGRSGQLLDKMLSAAGFKREDCYITNILPWRPPGNRAPTTAEVSVCIPFLKKQIDLIEPDILFILGGSAANSLLDNNEPISKLRGKWLEYKSSKGKKVEVLASFHPAYLLRNSAQKAKVWADLLRLSKKIAQ
jgi:DNA polymerase